MKNSKIEWTDHTVNFWWGCSEVSPACANCYAREWARYAGARLFGRAVGWGRGVPREERLKAAAKEARALDTQAMKKGARYRVFANSMSDWLDAEVPAAWRAEMLEVIRSTPYLDWLLLTKRPENWHALLGEVQAWCLLPEREGAWVELSDWLLQWRDGHAPENVWVGTTVEDQARADERVPMLLRIPAVVRYLSCEPLLEEVELKPYLHVSKGVRVCASCGFFTNRSSESICPNDGAELRSDYGIDWVIAGGESGKDSKKVRPMNPAWVRSLRDQCQAAGVPFLFKQWGCWSPPGQHLEGLEREKFRGRKLEDGPLMLFAGKELAGRVLDGVTWDEFPRVG